MVHRQYIVCAIVKADTLVVASAAYAVRRHSVFARPGACPVIIIIIIIKNECHSNIIVDRLQGCSAKKTDVDYQGKGWSC